MESRKKLQRNDTNLKSRDGKAFRLYIFLILLPTLRARTFDNENPYSRLRTILPMGIMATKKQCVIFKIMARSNSHFNLNESEFFASYQIFSRAD